MYPERWDKSSEADLHTHLFRRVSENSDISYSGTNMIEVAQDIIRCCMEFRASTFFKWKSKPFDRRGNVQISYTAAFSDYIGNLVR
jgi:hypothetical protein